MQQEQKILNYLSKLVAEFTADEATDLITSSGHGLNNEDLIQLTTDGTLPVGLEVTTNYYVINATTDTFQVSLTKGGVAVDITGDTTDTDSFHLKGKTIFVDGFEHIGLAANFYGTANFTIKFQGSQSEDMPDFNADQSPTNRWNYIDIVDLEDKSSIDGDTGISPSGANDNRIFEVNVNNLRWFTAVITAWTAGTAEVNVKNNKPY